ncbi:hypothetical protein AAZX31_14G190900 [Glycine max]
MQIFQTQIKPTFSNAVISWFIIMPQFLQLLEVVGLACMYSWFIQSVRPVICFSR